MKRFLLVMLMVATPAFGQGLDDDDDAYDRQERQDNRLDRQDRRAQRQERRERLRKEMELRRTLRISDEVGLSESQSLQISAVLKQGDEKRQRLRQEMRKAFEELQTLAKGSGSAKDVDATIKRIQDLRIQMLKSEDETLEQAAKGLTPIQKAKLAIVLGTHERQMRQLLFKETGQRREQ